MKNYLTDSILRVFERLEYYKGYVFHLENDIKKYTQSLIDKLDNNKTNFLKGSRLVISDFTGESDNGWEINFPLPTSGYFVTSDNYLEKNNQLIQFISSTLVAQSYEAIETFFKEILISYFENNNQIAFETIGKANCILNKNNVDWNNTVRKLNQGTNNKGLLKIIRILSTEFCKAERTNLKNIDLEKWFDMVSIIRHSIIHSESILKNNEFNKIDKYERKILEKFFEVENQNGGNKRIIISGKHASNVIEFMSEYAFQVFKGLSISADLDWRILINMKKNEA